MAVAGRHARERAPVTAGGPLERPGVSLIATVLNEAESVDALLASVAAQTQRPDEIVVVDGGSADGTPRRLAAWQARLPLRLLSRPGTSISAGRNAAIQAAQGEWIAATDAGVWLEPTWLERLCQAAPGADVVGGFFLADPRSTFERALGATTLPGLADVRPTTFLPSSRSVLFRRAAWEVVGGYPEWLDYGEDLVFDLALKRAGYRFAFAPGAVAHFRPRPGPRAFFRQYYLYARGDGKADLWRARHAVRYATYLSAAALLRLAGGRPATWALLALGGAVYTRRPYARLLPALAGRPLRERALALALVPGLRALGDAAKMLGYPVGVAWRLRRGGAHW